MALQDHNRKKFKTFKLKKKIILKSAPKPAEPAKRKPTQRTIG